MLNLFQNQPDEDRQIKAIQKCINKKKPTAYDILRLKMINELKKN